MADLSPADQLHALLVPSTTEGQQAIEGNDTLKRLSVQYKDALEKQNVGQLTETIGSITRELNNAHLFEPDADRVIGTYNFAPYETRPETSREETAAPVAPGLKEFLPKESGGDGGVTTIQEQAQTKLKDVQKKATLDAFNALLDQYKNLPDKLPGAIDEFYRTHLSAAGVLGNQYKILLTQAKKLYGKNDEFDKHEDALKKQASESVEKLQAIHQIGPLQDPKDQEQREVELNHLERLRSNGINRDALIKSASNMFDEQWDGRQVGKIVDQFAHELASMDFSYEDIVQGVTSMMTTTIVQTPDEEEEPQPIPQGAQGGRGGGVGLGRKVVGKAKNAVESGAKKVVKEGAKDIVETGAKALATEGGEAAAEGLAATIEVWGPPVAIGCAVILAAILITIVVALLLFLFFRSSTSGTPAALPKSCDPSITCVANLKTMGITLQGDLAYNRDPYGKAKLIYDTLALITQSPSKYGALLGIPSKQITIDLQPGGCAGHASTNGTVNLWGFGTCGDGVAKFMLIHELSHEIAFRNPELYNKFYNQFPLPVLAFYKLPTYNCELDYGPGGPFPGECFADTIGEYVVYKYYRNTLSGPFGVRIPVYYEAVFSSFPHAFAPFYNFAKDNVFMGLEF